MFGKRGVRVNSNNRILMRLNTHVGASPITTIGQAAMTQTRLDLHEALHATGYTLRNRETARDGVISYNGLFAFLYHMGPEIDDEGNIDSRFLRALSEMAAVWRYSGLIDQATFERKVTWLHTMIESNRPSDASIKETLNEVWKTILDSWNMPDIPVDETTQYWTQNSYTGMDRIPAPVLELWIVKISGWLTDLYPGEILACINHMMTRAAVTADDNAKIRVAKDAVATLDVSAYWNSLDITQKVRFWETRAAVCRDHGERLICCGAFTATAAICKGGTATDNWVTSRVNRWTGVILDYLKEGDKCGREAIARFYTLNAPREEDVDKIYDFLATTYYSAHILNNAPILWMVEQCRCHHIASAVMFSELIDAIPDFPLGSLLQIVPMAEWRAFFTLVCYTFQDPFCHLVRPLVPATAYKRLGDLGANYSQAKLRGDSRNRNQAIVAGRPIAKWVMDQRVLMELTSGAEESARRIFQPTTDELRAMKISNYVIEDGNVYVDFATPDGQAPEALKATVDEELLLAARRRWPDRAKMFSKDAQILTLADFKAAVVKSETPGSKAARDVITEFYAFCAQQQLNPVSTRNRGSSYTIEDRRQRLPEHIVDKIKIVIAGFVAPVLPETGAKTEVLLTDDQTNFNILFHPLPAVTLDIRDAPQSNEKQTRDEQVLAGGALVQKEEKTPGIPLTMDVLYSDVINHRPIVDDLQEEIGTKVQHIRLNIMRGISNEIITVDSVWAAVLGDNSKTLAKNILMSDWSDYFALSDDWQGAMTTALVALTGRLIHGVQLDIRNSDKKIIRSLLAVSYEIGTKITENVALPSSIDNMVSIDPTVGFSITRPITGKVIGDLVARACFAVKRRENNPIPYEALQFMDGLRRGIGVLLYSRGLDGGLATSLIPPYITLWWLDYLIRQNIMWSVMNQASATSEPVMQFWDKFKTSYDATFAITTSTTVGLMASYVAASLIKASVVPVRDTEDQLDGAMREVSVHD